MTELLLGAAGALLLYVFFRAVEARWPENYYGLSDLTSYQLSLRLTSYVGFRFLPVVVVSFAVSVIADSFGRRGWLAAIVRNRTEVLDLNPHSGFEIWSAEIP